MHRLHRFTLMELMVVIAIIVILSAIALPGYQRYLDRAALTDMLWIASPSRLTVELYAMQKGDIDSCHTGQKGVPASHLSRYISVHQGVVSLTGRHTLVELTLVMSPEQLGARQPIAKTNNGQLHASQRALVGHRHPGCAAATCALPRGV